MAKRKNLKGLPGNLANSYLSTLSYHSGGYSADWLYNIAQTNNLNFIKIDIINNIIQPEIAMVPPLVADLPKLNTILATEVNNNGFEISIIKEAVLEFTFETNEGENGWVICNPFIIDTDGVKYEPKQRILEKAERNKNLEYL